MKNLMSSLTRKIELQQKAAHLQNQESIFSFNNVPFVKRRNDWVSWARRNGLLQIEWLLPLVRFEVPDARPSFMTRADERNDDAATLSAEMARQGPWTVPLYVGSGVTTFDNAQNIAEMDWRANLLGQTLEHFAQGQLTELTVLDMATRNGTFAFDAVHRGARHATGFDLRAQNIDQCNWLNTRYQMNNVDFVVGNAMSWNSDQFDVVLNYGLLYHVNEPHLLMRKTFDLCRKFAIIDTVARLEPIEAFFQVTDQDVEGRTSTGEFQYELHPTYRALITIMRDVGFVNIQEVVGNPIRNRRYEIGSRRTLVGFKP